MDTLDKQSHYCFGVCIQCSETAKKQINTSSGNKSYKKYKRVMGQSDRRWWGCIWLGCSGEVTGRVFKHKFKRIKEEVVQSNGRASTQKPWEESGFGKTTEAGGEEAKVARPTLCRLLKPYLNLSKMQSHWKLVFLQDQCDWGVKRGSGSQTSYCTVQVRDDGSLNQGNAQGMGHKRFPDGLDLRFIKREEPW